MPSLLHEALVLLFHNRPSLAPELLEDSLGDLPGCEAIRLDALRGLRATPSSLARASRGKSSAVILAAAAAIEAPARPPEDRVSKSTSVPFTYSAGAPPVVEVTAADGTKYVARMGSTVFEVLDTGETNPDGTPKFEFKVNLQFDVQRKSG